MQLFAKGRSGEIDVFGTTEQARIIDGHVANGCSTVLCRWSVRRDERPMGFR